MTTKLGDHIVVLEQDAPTGAEDEYGNAVSGKTWLEVHWSQITPAYSTEPTNRNSPSVVGMNWLAPPEWANRIMAADRVLWPWTRVNMPDGSVEYTGRRWDVIGEIGQWDEAVEVQLGRKV
jgi:hypothetical protein